MSTKYVVAPVMALIFCASPTLATTNGFAGFWGVIGGKKLTDMSLSTVSYDYIDKYAGSLNWPGWEKTGTYKDEAQDSPILPAVRLMYIAPVRSFFMGFSVSADQHAKRVLSAAPFDVATPTGTPDHAQGFAMKTTLEPAFDLSASIEPGITLGWALMAYAKLAYHQIDTRMSTSTSVTRGMINPVFTEASTDCSFKGVGAGGGLRLLYRPGFFVEAQYEYVMYGAFQAPASRMVSSADEVTMTQSQEIVLKYSALSLSIAAGF